MRVGGRLDRLRWRAWAPGFSAARARYEVVLTEWFAGEQAGVEIEHPSGLGCEIRVAGIRERCCQGLMASAARHLRTVHADINAMIPGLPSRGPAPDNSTRQRHVGPGTQFTGQRFHLGVRRRARTWIHSTETDFAEEDTNCSRSTPLHRPARRSSARTIGPVIPAPPRRLQAAPRIKAEPDYFRRTVSTQISSRSAMVSGGPSTAARTRRARNTRRHCADVRGVAG